MENTATTTVSMTIEQIKSLARVITHQGPENLVGIGQGDETLCVQFTHIFIGIEPDGYAHS